MAKRYYKVGEKVWIKTLKKMGDIVSLDIVNLQAIVSFETESKLVTESNFTFMEIDKLRTEETKPLKAVTKRDTVLFAKMREDAKIPSKRLEDAGYDIYANFPQDQMLLEKGKANLVPTGIASSLPTKYYYNLKHERGSTGKYAMAVLSGVVDSGYRGEWFINIAPMGKDVVISKTFEFPVVDGKKKPVELADAIYYPYDLAVAQATLDLVPDVRVKEITYDELKVIPSQRGMGKLGASGK